MEGHVEQTCGAMGHPSLAQRVRSQRRRNKVLADLVAAAENTAFGQDHGLARGLDVAEYQRAVPVRDYEGLKDTWTGP